MGQAPSCLIPRRGIPQARRRFSVKAGIDGVAYMHGRSLEDPFYALASGLMHAGQTSYTVQQPIVEKIMRLPPAERLKRLGTIGGARALIQGSGFSTLKSSAWPSAVGCWERYCAEDGGRGCLAPPGGGKLPARGVLFMRCMRDQLPGGVMGPKSYNLMAEYMGCDQAVAVDRHLANWLANSAGTLVWAQKVWYPREPTQQCKGKFQATRRGKQDVCSYEGRVWFMREEEEAKKSKLGGYPAVSGATIKGSRYAMMKREVMNLAGECGVSPAQLQVGAWIQGACDSLPGEGGGKKLYFGEGHSLNCDRVPRVDLGAPEKGYKIPLKLKPPGKYFRCRPDYLGGAASKAMGQRPEPVEIVTEPVLPPLGVKLHYDDVYPVVPEERLSAWVGELPPDLPRPRPEARPGAVAGLLTGKKRRRRMRT